MPPVGGIVQDMSGIGIGGLRGHISTASIVVNYTGR
jgi:hypothetical protein